MKHLIKGFYLAAIMAVFSCGKGEKTQSAPPNIIVFMVDDLGWQDSSVPFWEQKTPQNEKFHTPNMERLAEGGVKFTQAYAYSVCSPSRTSLMTGMSAARHRVTNWTLRKNQTVDAADDFLEFPAWNLNGLQPETVDAIPQTVSATTLPQLLKNHGFYTIHCGKAHWGAETTPGANPLNLGFDVNIGGHCAGGPGSYLGVRNFSAAWRNGGNIWDIPGLEKYHGTDINLTDALTLEAKAAMDNALAAAKPFYLYMAHYTVHVPLEPHEPFVQKYRAMGLEEPEALYASMVEGMDRSLGDLMVYLEEKSIAENTVILFMSDNGGLSVHARGGEPNTHNFPLNSGKGSAYEGGIRVPMLVRWPGKTTPGTKITSKVIVEDFFPSILEMAGVKNYRTVQTVDGRTFVPLILDPENEPDLRDLFWHFPNNWGPTGPGIGATSTIRSGNWKLVYYYLDQRFELFNISTDIGEKNNLAADNPGKVKELAGKLGEYLRSVDALRPAFKKTGEPAPWPDEV